MGPLEHITTWNTVLPLSVTVQFGLAWVTISHTWDLLQGELAFSDTHKAFLLLAVLTHLFRVEVGDFPHPLLAFLLRGGAGRLGSPACQHEASKSQKVSG